MSDAPPPGVPAAADLGLEVEVRDVGPSNSLEEHEAKLGLTPGSLCKTLLVRRGDDDYVFVVVPGGRKMAWPKLRAALGVSRASMAVREEVADVTGFEPGTVTALGSRRQLPVFLDQAAVGLAVMAVGSGRSGVSLLVAPDDYVRALGATVADVTVPDDAS